MGEVAAKRAQKGKNTNKNYSMEFRKYLGKNDRTIKVRKNIIFSTLLKGIDMFIYFLLVPITLNYLNPYEYGVWLTLSSILMWINSFDIGLGNGMRNKLAIALANNNRDLGKIYVSTTFIMLLLMIIPIIIIGIFCNYFIDWYNILGTDSSKISNLSSVVSISFIICCLNFVFSFIGNVYMALQLPAINNLIKLLGSLLSLIIIFFLTIFSSSNLLYVAIAYTCSPLIIYLIAYPITFKVKYKFLCPSLKCFKKEYLNDLLGVGLQFFLLQLSGIFLFSITNLLISNIFGPDKVTPFNISYKYFSLILIFMNLIITPIWSATTDAYYKGDIKWIKKSISNINKCIYLSSFILCVMLLLSPWIYNLWIGDSVNIPFTVSSLMALYIAILLTSSAYSNFLNGLGKLRIQTINTTIVALVSIPLLWLLGKNFNIQGLLIGMCILNISGLVLNIIQLKKVTDFKANGIWNK